MLLAVGAVKGMYGLEYRAGESMPPLVVRCIAADGTASGVLTTIKFRTVISSKGKAYSWPLQVRPLAFTGATSALAPLPRELILRRRLRRLRN